METTSNTNKLEKMHLSTDTVHIDIVGSADCLWRYTNPVVGVSQEIGPPRFEMDGRQTVAVLDNIVEVASPRKLTAKITEYVYRGTFRDNPEITIQMVFRVASEHPVIRFRYILECNGSHCLTKHDGRDYLQYLDTFIQEQDEATEVQLANFNELFHSFMLAETPITPEDFAHANSKVGPILTATDGDRALLLAYEHGSQSTDPFVAFELGADKHVSVAAVKGNYRTGQLLDDDHPYETLWFQLAIVQGGLDDLASAYRSYVLEGLSCNNSSRTPYIFYNTWAGQEREKWLKGGKYLDPINEQFILDEVDRAHRLGIDVFVIDTGWYEKTGDWQVSSKRFPDELQAVRERLDQYGMKLGLWFNPCAAAVSSRMLREYGDCVVEHDGQQPQPTPIWETEESVPLCLVSRYADAFAEKLIQLAQDLGVRYFKWDAIHQYQCDAAGHWHGDVENDVCERRDCYAFEQVRAMTRIVDKLTEAYPDAIVDFDITESGRSVGLAWLACGKYFLINNGPYYHNYDLPRSGVTGWSNILVNPGPARTWFCRTPLGYDRWLPSILFLTHYLPDDPEESQWLNIASLILGQNGIWGDLSALSDTGVSRIRRLLDLYKQVHFDINAAWPVRRDQPGETPEIHEKIAANGRGAVVVFGCNAKVQYVTKNKVDHRVWTGEGVDVRLDAQGYAVITVNLDKRGVGIVFFGVNDGMSNA